ncbi:MAG: TIGR02300 family protein [Rhodospirillaceae bacterium]|nr:TIGR02300 family protein [Rhodospirillaceae bacterium]MBT3928613.1 TIGR02300 family protein [Rhodospirillaceae bacterium]MBT4427306.1 TIGR02300 family protein [Rhodospirillaceae bacterium]MBT5037815.1 TIGR02300 family protein [Rhodospirillaceae bacterium]MBT5676396.1 TIGR02300 family protein [Rhodospirillaceae bacterium]
MANPKWGTKRMCLGCGKRFYDMQRSPIACPSCDAPFEIIPPGRTRRQRAPVEVVAAPVVETPVAAPVEVEGEEVKPVEDETGGTEDIAEADEKDAETLEDPSELGEDEDDVAEVLDGMEEPDKTDI